MRNVSNWNQHLVSYEEKDDKANAEGEVEQVTEECVELNESIPFQEEYDPLKRCDYDV
jgi:hypothetical protein